MVGKAPRLRGREAVHESRVLFELGRRKHLFHLGRLRFAVVIATNGATYDYGLALEGRATDEPTEPVPATFEGRGDEPAPAAAPAGRAAPGSGEVEPRSVIRGGMEAPAEQVVIRRQTPEQSLSAGGLLDIALRILTPALFVALVAASAGFPDAGALLCSLFAGAAGALAGRKWGAVAGAETLFSILGGLLGASLGLALGAGVFGLLAVIVLCALLLAPLPGSAAD